MKKSSDDLHRLIHALNKQEKRYFKLFAGKHIKDASQHYIGLFDALNREPAFDEKKFRAKYGKAPFLKHLPSNKNYLYKLILDSLGGYHAGMSTETVLNDMLKHVEILYSKGLFKPCKKTLARAKALAEKHEKYVFLLAVMDWEQRLMAVETYAGMSQKTIVRHYEEYKNIIEKVSNINHYRRASGLTVNFFVKKEGLRTEAEENYLENTTISEALMNEAHAATFQSKIYLFHSLGFYFMNKNDMEKAFRYNLKLVELLESHEEKIRERITNYISSLNNFLICCRRLKNYRAFLDALGKLKSIPDKYPETVSELASVSITVRVWIFEQEYYIHRGAFREGLGLAAAIEKGLPALEAKIKHPGQWIALHYNMAYLCFGAGEMKKALEWSNKVLNNKKIDAGKGMHNFCLLLNILIHYELGHTDLIPYLVRSARHFFDSTKSLYRFEKSMLRFFSGKLMGASSGKERKELYAYQVNVLKRIIHDHSLERKALDYFDFISWLESKVSGRPFASVIREKEDIIS